MPSPIANEIRRQIVTRHEAGETLIKLSEELSVSYNTVRKIWSHWQQYGKLTPNYDQAKKTGTRIYKAVYADAIEMKRQHPKWGAQLIQLELRVQYPQESLPAVRTLQQWFKQAGVNRPARVKRERVSVVKRGKHVHEVWAVDAKEQMKLEDGSAVSWMIVTDEGSGIMLECDTFSPQAMESSQRAGCESKLATDV